MTKSPANDFFKDVDYASIIDTIKGIYTSDGSINTLLDYERVLDEADLYAHKNWELGELVEGPQIKKYNVTCIFLYPEKLMPDPRGGKRLLHLGCRIHFKKTKIKVPVKVESADDFRPGTHYPKLVEKMVWLVRIEIPKELMNDVREGTIDLAGQTLDLDELDDAYEQDLDKEGIEQEDNQQQGQDQNMGTGMGQPQMPPGQQQPGVM
jgi:hypothetical protein